MNVATSTATVMARRPMAADFKPMQELTVAQLFDDPRVMKALAESATKHLPPQRMLRVMTQAVRKVPRLGLCSPVSLFGAMVTCSYLGLEPNTPLNHAYLIPFEKRKKSGSKWESDGFDINLIIGYEGLIDLARRTGLVVNITAQVVHEGDEFDYHYGTGMRLFHKPNDDGSERKRLYAYSYAQLKDGEAFEVRPYNYILRTRDATQAFKKAMEDKASGYKNWATTPWVAYEEEMASKTMVRRLAKWLPKSVEFASALHLDAMAEKGTLDFAAIGAQPTLVADPEMAQIEEPQTETATTTVETAKKPEPPAAAKKAKAEPEQKLSEQDEREADRMTRAQMEGGNAAEATLDEGEVDGWDAYLVKMTAELKTAATSGIAAEVNKAFRDAIVGAIQRNEITEERGNVLLGAWGKHYTAPAKNGNGKK